MLRLRWWASFAYACVCLRGIPALVTDNLCMPNHHMCLQNNRCDGRTLHNCHVLAAQPGQRLEVWHINRFNVNQTHIMQGKGLRLNLGSVSGEMSLLETATAACGWQCHRFRKAVNYKTLVTRDKHSDLVHFLTSEPQNKHQSDLTHNTHKTNACISLLACRNMAARSRSSLGLFELLMRACMPRI